MTDLEKLGEVIDVDVLVIGGGPSGLWTANRAREFVDDVLIVDKGPQDWGGLASMSGGDFDAVLPGESVDDWVKDLIYYYDGLCEQDVMEEIYKISYDRLQDYQRFGCQFLTLPDGKLKGIPQRGLDHIKLYPAKLKGRGGKDMTQGLVREAQRLGVKRLARTQVTDLLQHDGRVVGAVGFNTINGDFYIFRAKAVVLASGNGGWKPSYSQNTSTGDGLQMAWRAGAELRNGEFIKVWNVPHLFAWESQTTLLPLGARFVNAKGEAFMDKYSPILGANTDPHYIVIGMAIEAREGRGPFYLDTSKMNVPDIEMLKPQTGWQVLNYRKLVDLGIDLFTQNTEWMPQMLEGFSGLVADVEGRTKIPGLFTVARARNLDAGVYIGGFALCTTACTGYITGKVAAEYARSAHTSQVDGGQVEEFKKLLYAPLKKDGIRPKEVIRQIQETVFPYDVCILKSDASLKRALAQLEKIKEEMLPNMSAADSHFLLKLLEARGIFFITELYLRASLMRTETRAGHYREDYPERDDKNWLGWIVAGNRGGEIDLRLEPVPFNRYKFKLTQYYQDNFKYT
jgi:succinate dehydrogenase/fumarate reductase flavoprotein subunit